MRNLRAYYSSSIVDFLGKTDSEILGIIHTNDSLAQTNIQQSNTWESEVQILKSQLCSFTEGRIIFEYTIPRMGKRVDTVVLHKNIVFLLEFKCGDNEYRSSTYDQVYDYALDLRNFQKESHNKLLVPIMISTKAPTVSHEIVERDKIIEPLRCNSTNIWEAILRQHRTINGLRLCRTLACIFSVILPKFRLTGVSPSALNLYNLPKNLTSQSHDNNYAV